MSQKVVLGLGGVGIACAPDEFRPRSPLHLLLTSQLCREVPRTVILRLFICEARLIRPVQ
jgi:hypothetical protein